MTKSNQYAFDVTLENGVTILPVDEAFDDDKVIVAEAIWEGGKVRTFYKKGALKIKRCDGVSISEKAGTVYLKADRYIHTVELEGAEIFSDNFFSMLPGEEKTVTCEKAYKEITAVSYTLYR